MGTIDLTVLNKPDNDNMGGLARTAYVVKWADVTSWPTLPSSGPMGLAQKLVGNFAIRLTAEWRRFYLTPEMAELRDEPQGETDGMSFKHILEIAHPSNSAALLGFLRASNNEELVWLVEDAEGQLRCIGSERFPARMITGGGVSTGKKTGDKKGATAIFQSYGNGPAPIYTGTIDEDSAS